MISCTEFIPAYSELFSYLDEKYGRQEVDCFWKYLFEPDGKGIPLIHYVEKEGIRGCFSYWSGSLNEEAADFTMYLNEKRGFFMIKMHHCPSKGRLLDLKEEIGLEPYYDYCLHCDGYRRAIEKAGLKYIYNFQGTEHASCTLLAYDDQVFDGRIIIDEDTLVMDRKASDNEYFHRSFHRSLNNGIEYLGTKYGSEEVESFLVRYTKNVYQKAIVNIQKNGLAVIRDMIRETYKKEKAEEVLSMDLCEDSLTVKVAYCPAVRYLRDNGYSVSSWYHYTTEVVMKTLAEAMGFQFTMESYEEENGAAAYHFDR